MHVLIALLPAALVIGLFAATCRLNPERSRRTPAGGAGLLLLLVLASPAGAQARGLRLTAGASQAQSQVTSDEQLQSLHKAVTEAPDKRGARFALVQGLVQAGRPEQALNAAKAWRRVDAYNLIVVRMLGDLLMSLGRADEAMRTYSAVVELLADDARAQRAVATVLKQHGRLEDARACLQRAAELQPEDSRLAFELADVEMRLGHHAPAETLLKRIATDEAVAQELRLPARQRLAQLYTERLRTASDSDAAAHTQRALVQLDVPGGHDNDVKIYLSWDTDRTDVDLWVDTPGGERVYYEHKEGAHGERLYHDVTRGYGPESFSVRTAQPGTYELRVHFYGTQRQAFSEARGEVIVLLNEGRDNQQRHVLPYRLFQVGQSVLVGQVHVQ